MKDPHIQCMFYMRRFFFGLVYVRCSIICMKKLSLLARTGVRKTSSVACGVSPIKLDYSDYPKSFANRIKLMKFRG